jgi:hypothetical protein
LPSELIDFAEAAIEEWQSHEVFVLDVARLFYRFRWGREPANVDRGGMIGWRPTNRRARRPPVD